MQAILVNLRRRGCSGHHAQFGNTDILHRSKMRRRVQTSRPKSGTCPLDPYTQRAYPVDATHIPRETKPSLASVHTPESKTSGRGVEGRAKAICMYCIMHARHIATRVRESRGMRAMRECFRWPARLGADILVSRKLCWEEDSSHRSYPPMQTPERSCRVVKVGWVPG
ncbi:hypothetical protein KVT40_004634 [Elsinoe batatas]|uniref:Uncharacterized protein n=1 Tax=Elsinoe batatas TaxID=2601811 RepID=A0A8K0PEU7_9PEZI|nr:hypothetical protein KVT40_004634 [Elsinoe batatas]